MGLIIHNPNDEDKRNDLCQKMSIIHARAVLDYMNGLSCTYEEKINLLEKNMKTYQEITAKQAPGTFQR